MAVVAHEHHDDHGHHEESFVSKYIFSQDHKMIGKQFLMTAVFMGIVAMLLSLLFRIQLAWPGEKLMLRKSEREKRDIQESLTNTTYILEFASEAIVDGQLSGDATQGLYFVLSGVKDSLRKIAEDIDNLTVYEEKPSSSSSNAPIAIKKR